MFSIFDDLKQSIHLSYGVVLFLVPFLLALQNVILLKEMGQPVIDDR